MKILDCTLRDGGYYTNWDFDQQLVDDYCAAMEKLPIDYIEIGYRSMPKEEYLGEFFYCPEYLMKDLKHKMPSKKLVIILNEKDTREEDLDALLKDCKTYISMVRLAIAPDNVDRAIGLAIEIKARGFEVAFNVMYMSSWTENKSFISKLSTVNDKVDYFYMVDSYGGVTPQDINDIASLVKEQTTAPLGFHGHNNLEMGLINSLAAADTGCKIIDATVTGMGRGAGNLKTELLLTYLASKGEINISFDELSLCVSNFEELKKTYDWGTSLPYMVSGANSLPQKDVMEWVSKKRYSLSNIVTALQCLDHDKEKSSVPEFSSEKSYKNALIIGGGNTVEKHLVALKKFIEGREDLMLIHAGTRYAKLYKDVSANQYYSLVGNEGVRLKKIFGDLTSHYTPAVLPPSPRKMGTYIPEELKDQVSELETIDFTEKHKDSPLAIAIQLALNCRASTIYFAGFDGYEDAELTKATIELSTENQYLFDQLTKENIEAIFITETNYEHLKRKSVFSLI